MQHPNRRAVLMAGAGLLTAGLPWSALSASKIKPDDRSALIVVDVQNCFVAGGTLPVAKGEEVVPPVNRLS